jgi:colicin import membrane protein
MKRIIVLMMAVFVVFSLKSYSQEKTSKTINKPATVQTIKKDAKTDVKAVKTEAKTDVKEAKTEAKTEVKAAKTEAKTDVKAVTAGKPGPGDKVVSDKKGPEGETVYQGPKGGQYFINKNGERKYLIPEKK